MTRAFLLITVVLAIVLSASAQEGQPSPARWLDLLAMNGGQPSLSATGEGITSYKITDLYQRGKMQVKLVKPSEAPFKIELPIGYTIFNNLMYSVETDAVFTGPTDISFTLPSAKTKETFAQVRILYADTDWADPQVPKWIDATLTTDNLTRGSQTFSQSEIKQRLQNFEKRTLHAFTEYDEPRVILVALVDPSKVRDKFTADLQLSGTATSQVTEGRTVTYKLKITNKGPDTASAISFHSDPSFSFVSVTPSQGKCTMGGQNVYCKFPGLDKDRTIDIKIVERCEWRQHFPNGPPGYETPTSSVFKHITIGATEQDPDFENNQLALTTEVYPDSNQAPVIEVLSPTMSQVFPGPAATVPIRFKASDPDGFIKKFEILGHGLKAPPKVLGEPTLRADGEYELLYKDVPFGRQWVTIKATDNLGREEKITAPEFFVNGLARVQITSPKAGTKLNKADGEFTVTIHASGPVPLKKVSLGFWDSDATPVGNDDYVVKVKSCLRRCRLEAIAIDENGVESHAEAVEVTILNPPEANVRWWDGESWNDFEPGKPYRIREFILGGTAENDITYGAPVKKIELFLNGALICTDNYPGSVNQGDCVWRPAPGKYKLQAVATDEDGGVGKSPLIEVTIELP